MLKIENLSFSYGKTQVFKDIDLQIDEGINILIGPNAAGKSTLVKSIFGLLSPKGHISWKGKNLQDLNLEDRMELMVYIPQEDIAGNSLTVFETVLLGRLSSLTFKVQDKDLDAVMNALKTLRIENLAKRRLGELSGGQKKLVSIAQSLVRSPEIILMDEPTNNLDIQRQLELFYVMSKISTEKKILFIIVMHDINLSLKFADNLIIMNSKGQIEKQGIPENIIDEEILEEVYNIKAKVYRIDEKTMVWPEKSIGYSIKG
ncbi:MAG: ABC transporter ATP-binding protein [Clostridiaceae bacterium]|nr:ABC transporter ATP-binding protein [Clostridiaceae bacterium]